MAKEFQTQTQTQTAPSPRAAPATTATTPKYRVSLACPTPLANKELVVEAANEDQAREEFCRANGISGSVHPWSITRVS